MPWRQRQTNGRAASPLRAEKGTPSDIPAAPWEGRTGKWCGNQEAPPARARGATCSPWRISILFVSIFPPVISASPLQSQMANMAEEISICVKDGDYGCGPFSSRWTFLLTVAHPDFHCTIDQPGLTCHFFISLTGGGEEKKPCLGLQRCVDEAHKQPLRV